MLSSKAVELPNWVSSFNAVNPSPRELVGGKGAGLAEMTASGVPVPPGFTITTDACSAYVAGSDGLPKA